MDSLKKKDVNLLESYYRRPVLKTRGERSVIFPTVLIIAFISVSGATYYLTSIRNKLSRELAQLELYFENNTTQIKFNEASRLLSENVKLSSIIDELTAAAERSAPDKSISSSDMNRVFSCLEEGESFSQLDYSRELSRLSLTAVVGSAQKVRELSIRLEATGLFKKVNYFAYGYDISGGGYSVLIECVLIEK